MKKYIIKCYTFLKTFILYAIDKEIGRHAQALSFSTVLTLIPLTTIFLGVFASSSLANIAKKTLETMLENNLFPNAISSTFSTYITVFTSQAANIKFVGLTFLIISICLLFRDMENSFSLIIDCKTTKKWYFRLFSMFLLFFVPIFILFIFGFSEWLTSMSFKSIQDIIYHLIHYKIIIKFILFILTWGWFLFLFKVLPHKYIAFKSLLIGSLLATIAFNISQILFGLYVESFSTYEIIYGVFSAIPVFLLWIYLNWQITLYGLLIAYIIDNPTYNK